MLAASGDVPLSDRVLGRIAGQGAGNPFFLRELVAIATSSGDDLPESVERVVAARIDALTPRERLDLRTASVLGVSAELDAIHSRVRWRHSSQALTPTPDLIREG